MSDSTSQQPGERGYEDDDLFADLREEFNADPTPSAPSTGSLAVVGVDERDLLELCDAHEQFAERGVTCAAPVTSVISPLGPAFDARTGLPLRRFSPTPPRSVRPFDPLSGGIDMDAKVPPPPIRSTASLVIAACSSVDRAGKAIAAANGRMDSSQNTVRELLKKCGVVE